MERAGMRWLRAVVATIGFAGGLAFAAAFTWSWIDPVGVEKRARDAILTEVQTRVDVAIEAVGVAGDDRLAVIARRFSERQRRQAAAWDAELKEWSRTYVIRICREMYAVPPEDREKFKVNIDRIRLENMLDQEALQAKLEPLIRGQFIHVVEALLREFRIFTGTNAVVLFLLGAAALSRRVAGLTLLPAAVLVVVGSAYVSWSYLFKQDWLHAILFGDYMGLAFVGYVATTVLILWDVVLNRARLTRHAPGFVLLFLAVVYFGIF